MPNSAFLGSASFGLRGPSTLAAVHLEGLRLALLFAPFPYWIAFGPRFALSIAGWFNPSATTHRESRCLSAPGLLGFGFGFPSELRPVLALADPHARHRGVCQMSDLADPRRSKISRFKARLGVLRTRDLICRWVLLQRPDPPRAPRLGGRVSRYNGDKARSLDGRSW